MTKLFMRFSYGALIALILLAAMAMTGLAQSHPVEGNYNVTATSSELGTINFVMILKRDGGKWTGEVKDSPNPLTVTSVTVDDSNKVTIVADAGGTPVTIVGKFDGGKIVGDWSAGDIKGTWTALKKDDAAKSAAPAPATAAAGGASSAAGIEGTYDAKVIADGQGELPFTLIIKRDGDKLVTEVPGGGDLLIVGIETTDPDVVKLSATFQGNPFPLPGKRSNPDEMSGKWEAGGFSGTWSAKRKK